MICRAQCARPRPSLAGCHLAGPPQWVSCLVGQAFVWGPSARTAWQAAWSSKKPCLRTEKPSDAFPLPGWAHLCKQSALQRMDEVLEED